MLINRYIVNQPNLKLMECKIQFKGGQLLLLFYAKEIREEWINIIQTYIDFANLMYFTRA